MSQPLEIAPPPVVKPYPLEPSLIYGPKKERIQTDRICLYIFLAIFGIWLFAGLFIAVMGKIKRFYTLLDFDGNECGISKGFEDYPYLYWGSLEYVSVFKGSEVSFHKRTVCVKKCPTWKDGDQPPKTLECKPNNFFATCDTTQDPRDNKKIYVYKTDPVMDVLCTGIPVRNAGFLTSAVDDIMGRFIRGLVNHLGRIFGIILLTTLVGVFVMIIIRFCAGVIVWTLIVLVICILLLIGTSLLTSSLRMDDGFFKRLLLYAGIIITAIGVGLLIYIILNFNNVKIVIGVFKATGQFVAEEPLMVGLTCGKMLADIAFMALWGMLMVWLYSMGPKTPIGNHEFFGNLQNPSYAQTLKAYIFTMGIWIQAVVIHSLYFVNCMAVTLWYFKALNPGLPIVQTAITWTYLYHMGSAAVGASIAIAMNCIGWLIGRGGEDNDKTLVGKFCCCCCICFDRLVEHLKKKAYCQISLTGKNFCDAALDAFWLSVRNVILTSTLVSLKSVIIFIGKMAILLLPSLIGVGWILSSTKWNEEIPAISVAAMLIINYSLASGFMSTWNAGTDAMLHLYCVDEELFLGSKYAPDILKEISHEIKGF